MPDVNYDIYLLGKVKEPAQRELNVAVLAKLLKLDTAKAEQLLSGKPSVLKRGANKEQAEDYKKLLESKGILVHIKKHSSHTSAETTQKGREKNNGESKAGNNVASERGAKQVKSTAASPPSAPARKNTATQAPSAHPETNSVSNHTSAGIADLVEKLRTLTLSPTLSFASRAKMWWICTLCCVFLVLSGLLFMGALVGVCYSLYSLVSALFTGATGAFFSSLMGLILSLFVGFTFSRLIVETRHIALTHTLGANRAEASANAPVSFNLIVLTKHVLACVGGADVPSLRFSAQADTAAVNSRLLPGKRGANIVFGLSSVLALSQAELVANIAAVVSQFKYKKLLAFSSSLVGVADVCKALVDGNDAWMQYVQFYAVSPRSETNASDSEDTSSGNQSPFQSLPPLTRIWLTGCTKFLSLHGYVYKPLLWCCLTLSLKLEQQWIAFKDNTMCRLLGNEGFESFLLKQFHAQKLLEAQVESIETAKLRSGLPKLVEAVPLVIASQVQVRMNNESSADQSYKSIQDEFFGSVIGMPKALIGSEVILNGASCYQRIDQLDGEAPSILNHIDGQAYSVVERPQELAKEVTTLFYLEHGLPVGSYDIIESKNYLKKQGVASARTQVLDQYYNGWFDVDTFWQFGPLHAKDESGANSQIADINRLVRVLRHSSPDFQTARRAMPELRSRYFKHRLALEVHKAGYRNDAAALEELGIVASQVGELAGRIKHHKKNIEENAATQKKLKGFMGAKVSLVAGLIGEGAAAKQVRSVISSLAKLQVCAEKHREFWPQCVLLSQLCERMSSRKEPAHEARIKRLRKQLLDVMEEINHSLMRFNWVFDQDYQNLQQRLVAEKGSRPLSLKGDKYESPENWMQASSTIATKHPQDSAVITEFCELWHGLCALNYELNMRLAVSLKKVETAYKVPPIKIASAE